MPYGRAKVDPAKIRRLRQAKKLDQTEFAFRLRQRGLGATQATVSRWESGQEPRPHALRAIAAEFGVTVDELFVDDDDEDSSQAVGRDPEQLVEMLVDMVSQRMAERNAAEAKA